MATEASEGQSGTLLVMRCRLPVWEELPSAGAGNTKDER